MYIGFPLLYGNFVWKLPFRVLLNHKRISVEGPFAMDGLLSTRTRYPIM